MNVLLMTLHAAAAEVSDPIPGECAHCRRAVWEDLWTLDDANNVWAGQCPYCGAINLLSMQFGLRGYDSSRMALVLPTTEEIEANGLPPDTPTCGPAGVPAVRYGSCLAEITHRLADTTHRPDPVDDGTAPKEDHAG